MYDFVEFRHDRLDDWMDEQGLSSAEVAELCGLTYNYLYILRLGRRPNISATNVMKIALAVGVSVDWLCNASDDPLGRASQGGAGEVELLLAFRALSLARQGAELQRRRLELNEQAGRALRLADVAAMGPAILERADVRGVNGWLRKHVRLYISGNHVEVVEWV